MILTLIKIEQKLSKAARQGVTAPGDAGEKVFVRRREEREEKEGRRRKRRSGLFMQKREREGEGERRGES
jgi:hypothetical protein